MAKKEKDGGAQLEGAPYPANWIVDESQRPETLLERHRKTAANPAAHEVYRQAVETKAREHGLIHVDPATGYRARFQPADAAA